MTAPRLNDRLADFHPLPRGLYRRREYNRLSLAARCLLVDAHMLADDNESDGVVTTTDLTALGVFARLGPSDTEAATAELVASGFLVAGSSADEFSLEGFRGLSREEWDRRRQEGAAKRSAATERTRRWRARKAEEDAEAVCTEPTGTVTRHRDALGDAVTVTPS